MKGLYYEKCAIYCRVSRNEQSCERQLFELREVAENHKYQIVSEYVDEGVSGIKESRPEFDRMMNDVHIRKFDILLVVELSRLVVQLNKCVISQIHLNTKILTCM